MTTFFASESAAGLVFDVSAACLAVGELQQAVRARHTGSVSSFRDELLFRIAFFAGVFALPLGVTFVPGADIAGPAIFVVGAVAAWSGLLVRWWSFVTLGRLFTLVVRASAGQPIVGRGPYRFVRHPGYTGLLFAFLGGGLMLGNWVGTAVCVTVIAAALAFRLLREEEALIAATGGAYLRYAEGRPRLVPGIW